jgi:hypothetical protein
MWDSNLQPFGGLHMGMTMYITKGLVNMGFQIASNWSRMARIDMNVAHLQVMLTRHKVMVKVVPMKVGI